MYNGLVLRLGTWVCFSNKGDVRDRNYTTENIMEETLTVVFPWATNASLSYIVSRCHPRHFRSIEIGTS